MTEGVTHRHAGGRPTTGSLAFMRRESARKRPKPTTAPAVRGGGGGGEKSWKVRTVAVDEEASAEETETEDDDDDEGAEERDGIGVSKVRVMTCESYDAYLRSKPESRKRRRRELERVGERRSRDRDGNVYGDGGEGTPRKAWYHTGPRERRVVAPTGKIAIQEPKHALDALATTAFTKAAGTAEQYAGDQLCAVCDTRSTPQWRIFPKRFVAPRTCDSGSVVCNKCYAKAKRAAAIRTRDAAG